MSDRRKTERVYEGRSIVGGSAHGRFIALDRSTHEVYRVALEPDAVEAEHRRLEQAIDAAHRDLAQTRSAVPSELHDELAPIFDAQGLLLEDELLQAKIRDRIARERVNAEWAVLETTRNLAKTFAEFDTSHLRDKADDLHDVARALIRGLSEDHSARRDGLLLGSPAVLFGHDLTPSEAIRLSRSGVVGIALEIGGQASHTAIIARALNIPLVAGLAEISEAELEAEEAIVDGDDGLLILHPGPATIERYRSRAQESARREDQFASEAATPAETLDGEPVCLMANIDLPEELPDARRFGCEGIGLYRSEFLFIEKSPTLPTEDEQLELLRDLIEAAKPYPAVVRTFDLGGRKLAKEVIETDEENPVLGLRGIRITLQRRDIFKSQLRAILRAGVFGRLRVLLPMVTGVPEIRQFRVLVEDAARELESEGITHKLDFRLGAMIEVPSAALIADRIAREVDFLSLGTNDLVQYALAVDRNNEHVAYLYHPFHPAILRMVRFVVDSARSAGISVMICGEVAADPKATALLLGLGLRRLSVTPRAIPVIKQQVRAFSAGRLAKVVERCLDSDSPEDVEEELRQAGLEV